MATPQDPRPAGAWRRRLALAGVIGAVVLVHVLFTQGMVRQLEGLNNGTEQGIERMEATMVADMHLSTPPTVALPPPAPEPVAMPAPAPIAASAASQPASKPKAPDQRAEEADLAASAASIPASSAASEPVQLAQAAASEASGPSRSASASEEANATAPSMPPATEPSPTASTFEWPLATRVTFKAEGYIRGPIYGQAQVEWVRQGLHYQVHVDASVGPSFAPLGSQRWTSEGEITPQGLEPKRFESINKLLIASSTPKRVTFRLEEIELADGQRVPKLPMVQDPASHYIQLAYQALLDPSLMRVGGTISMPIALTKKQITLVYDIEAQETLDTPLGKIETFKLKPRPLPDQKEKDEILAEIWVAPSLQYLPIRMLLRQGKANYLDMKMDKMPQQAAAPPSDTPRPPDQK